MERFSGLNRSEVLGPSGIGFFAFVSDSVVGPFSYIGALKSRFR